MYHEKGFTLIELLILVAIIGALSAIAIPQFTSRKGEAFDAAVQSDIRKMMAAQHVYFLTNQRYAAGTIGSGGSADLNRDGTPNFHATKGIALTITAYPDGYQITAKHASSPRAWCVNSSPANATGVVGRIVQATKC